MTLKEYQENHREYYVEKCICCGTTVYSDEPFDRLPVCESCLEEDFEDDEIE